MAPNVDDYNSKVAKQMAKGVGDIIQGIFWLRDSTVAQLENGSTFVRGRVKPSSKPTTNTPELEEVPPSVKFSSSSTRGC